MSRRNSQRRKGNAMSGGDFTVIKAEDEANRIVGSSRQLDEFTYGNDVLTPPYEPKDLIALIERNDTIKQNIEALASNVANFGWGIKFQDDFDYGAAKFDNKELANQADKEWETLRLMYKSVNPLHDLNNLIYKMAVDLYSFGWGMLEITRNGVGMVKGVEYCRACNFRLAYNMDSQTTIKVWEETENGIEQNDSYVRFKKIVQLINGKKIYFKELGDLRPMSKITGEYGESIPEEDSAGEIAYFSIHSSYSDYGVPHWINTAITASGNVMSEILNYKYFQDGRILPMALTVSGGELTEASLKALSDGKGIDNAFKILLLEALPSKDDDNDNCERVNSFIQNEPHTGVSIDVKSLTDTNNKDALFREYQRDGKEKIRNSLRLPPIYTGAASDYNRATADTARAIAEEQIFVPERKMICNIFNKIVNNELGIRFVEMYLKAPNMSDLDQKANILRTLNSAGALTPNMLLPVVEEVLGGDIEAFNEEWGNIPFELLKLKVQHENNKGDTNVAEEDIEKSELDIIDELNNLVESIKSELVDSGYE